MDKLSKSEIKILKILDKHVGIPSGKEETIEVFNGYFSV